METRSHKATAEVRQGINGPMITGYAAVFNSNSENLGGFIEQVDPGAFTKTLQEADVRALVNHDADQLLGRTKTGTMRLSTDSTGLRYEIDVNPQDPAAMSTLAKVQRRDLDGSSFSFQCVRDEWNWDTQPAERRLLEVALVDCGPVVYPAYGATSAAARALDRIASKLNRPVDELVAALGTGEMRSLMEPETQADPLAAEVARVMEELRAMDMGGDPENLESMIGAVLQSHHGQLAKLGMTPSEGGATVRPLADQDGDADGDGQTLWQVSDDNGDFYHAADGGNADFVAWNAGSQGGDGDGNGREARSAEDLASVLKLREREQEQLELERARRIEKEKRGASGATTLTLGTRNETWNAASAVKSLQPADYSKAFFWKDPSKPADQVGAWKLPFAERGMGTGDGASGLHAVWGAITAAAGAINGARGGVSIPDADVAAVKSRIGAYYSKAAKQFKDDTIKVPW